jgi:hypothetical protein
MVAWPSRRLTAAVAGPRGRRRCWRGRRGAGRQYSLRRRGPDTRAVVATTTMGSRRRRRQRGPDSGSVRSSRFLDSPVVV